MQTEEAVLYAFELPEDLPENHGYKSGTWHQSHELLAAEGDRLKTGDLIEIHAVHQLNIADRMELRKTGSLFRHWAIYIGEMNGHAMVVNFFGESILGHSEQIRLNRLSNLPGLCRINNICDEFFAYYSPKEVAQRAVGLLGRKSYDAMNHNCENFANWCRYGKYISRQPESMGHTILSASSITCILGVASGNHQIAAFGLALLLLNEACFLHDEFVSRQHNWLSLIFWLTGYAAWIVGLATGKYLISALGLGLGVFEDVCFLSDRFKIFLASLP